ncbi:alpha/beta hydrolase [Actinomadura kijaniata]|uniref:Pimeloyl-ACP methyl ester carboxylesterase n=1 Tax=Actinomadura namibiensis TaxID=182080 RepID=A0A7W3LYY3_ACTNM|nr:alpha/beta hydrolase [Actinomadura namibiensis]MBA8956775.1 pimeloyl-ACP methyl ester carboxylesterase [Actinomadura namibiensis]
MTSPTVVLVHGAFADASSWRPVVARLRAAGTNARAVANPLRGLTHDGEYVASLVSQIDGPVVLVGHSYGGPVITHAAAVAANVTGLVYVAAFGLDTGMSALSSVEGFPPAELGTALVPAAYPDGEGSATEFTIDPARFHSVFCADLPAEDAALMAASQRPVAESALAQPLAVEPAWKRLPSRFVVAAADHAIDPGAQRAAAARVGADTVELDGASHAVALSRPDEVAQVIGAAAGA